MLNFEKQGPEKEEEILKKAREELEELQKKERNREVKSAHLAGAAGKKDVDLNKITDDDVRMYVKISRGEVTKEEFDEFRKQIPPDDYDRNEFLAFLINKWTVKRFKKE